MNSKPQTPISNRGFDAQFLCNIPYTRPLVLDGVIASIDNVRIKYLYKQDFYNHATGQKIDTVPYLLNTLNSLESWMTGKYDIVSSHYSFRIGSYADTLTFKLPDGNSFSLLAGRYCFNETKQVAPEIILDCNPNKIQEDIWTEVSDILAPLAQEISVQRIDIALDFPIPRDHLELKQRSGTTHRKFSDKDMAVTEYTGNRSKHLAVKLYDKGADLGIDLTCTRLEITAEASKFTSLDKLFPEIHRLGDVELNMDFDKLPFDLQAVILYPALYNRLKSSVSRNTWTKYKKILADYESSADRSCHLRFELPKDQILQIDRFIRQRIHSFQIAGTIENKLLSNN